MILLALLLLVLVFNPGIFMVGAALFAVLFVLFLLLSAFGVPNDMLPVALALIVVLLLVCGFIYVAIDDKIKAHKNKQKISVMHTKQNTHKPKKPPQQQKNNKPPKPKPLYDFGEYREYLPSGGELVVTLHGWAIQYAFPGPDRRYNWTFIELFGSQIEKHAHAWKINYAEYKNLKRLNGPGAQIVKEGVSGMMIRCGSYPEGVCLRDYHMPISTDEQLAMVLSDYEGIDPKARTIIKILSNPDSETELRLLLTALLRWRMTNLN